MSKEDYKPVRSVRTLQVTSSGPPSFEYFGSYDGFEIRFPLYIKSADEFGINESELDNG